jgi:hypothetical protein
MNAICKADFIKREKAHSEAEKAMEKAKKEGKSTSGIIVPEFGFHDIYGVWFFGKLKEIIKQVGTDQFGVDLSNQMHVFVDIEPKKISDGIHDVNVYGYKCRLYKWKAQGYHRGLIVLTDDETGKRDARVYRKSGTWSWILKDEEQTG